MTKEADVIRLDKERRRRLRRRLVQLALGAIEAYGRALAPALGAGTSERA
jgi:hypothetical protein